MTRYLEAAHQTNLTDDFGSNRDERLYLDFRQIEYPDVGSGSPVFSKVTEDEDLVLHLPMNETSGATAYDRSGNGHDCTWTNSPVYTTGKIGNAIDLERGSTQYGTVAHHADLEFGTGDFTISLWIKLETLPSAAGGNFYVIDKHTAGVFEGYFLYLDNADDKIKFAILDGAGGFDLCISNAALIAATWYHIIAERASGVMTLYVDTSAQTDTELNTEDVDTGDDIRIGATSTPSSYFDGLIDEVRIDSRALSQTERTELYNLGIAPQHKVPGSHFFDSGYTQHLLRCPRVGTVRCRVKLTDNLANTQYVIDWRTASDTGLILYYLGGSTDYRIFWQNGGTARFINGAPGGGVDQEWHDVVYTWDLDNETGAIWVDKTLIDDSWSGALDAGEPELPIATINANLAGSGAGRCDIAYLGYFPDYECTDADVQNDFKDVEEEEIFFGMNGHATGRTRCNVTRFWIKDYSLEKSVRDRLSGAWGSNKLSVTLKNTSGEFSDDQYAAYDPSADSFNGTSSQAYLRNRSGIILETWYSDDFDFLFTGRLTTGGYSRQSIRKDVSYVSCSAEDAVAELATSYETTGRYWENDTLIDTSTEGDSILHNVARRANRRWRNYLNNSSFENGTIGDSWLVTAGGTLNKDAADGLFGSASAELIPGAANEQMYQTVQFLWEDKINVGDVFNFSCWLKSAAGATAVENYIAIFEDDSGGNNDYTGETYDLSGGEGWVKYDVTHTITDSDSDRLRVKVAADAGDTINIDGAMLIRNDRDVNYFILNSNDSDVSSGISGAYDYTEGDWDWFGFNTTTVDYIHPWRRMDRGTTVWKELQQLGDAIGAYYIGFDECGTLTTKGILEENYSDPTCQRMLDETEIRNNIRTRLTPARANKIIGHGVSIKKSSNLEFVWQATASDTWKDDEISGGFALNLSIANGDYFPDVDDYPEYWAQLGKTEDKSKILESAVADYIAALNAGSSTAIDWAKSDINSVINTDYQSAEGYSVLIGGGGAGNQTYTIFVAFRPSYPIYLRGGASDKIIGLQNADLLHKLSDTGDGNSTLTEVSRGISGQEGYLINGLDATSRPDEVRFLLYNNTGSAVTLRDVGLIGKIVTMKSGEQGYIHDQFQDREDIATNGEQILEFGNSDILGDVREGAVGANPTQLEALADYWWKYCKDNKHLYDIPLYGERHWFFPGDYTKLEIGGAGEAEYIDSMSQVTGVKITRNADGIGSTSVTFNEVEEAWKADSNAIARYFATGKLVRSRNPGYVTVASQYYIGEADFRCTGSSDEDVINNAITFVNGAYGGGTVHLTKGIYKTGAAIEMASNVILEGEGMQTLIERNANDYAIEAVGGAGTELTNVQITNIKIAVNVADTNVIAAILGSYSDDMIIDHIYIYDVPGPGISIANCDGVMIGRCIIHGFTLSGISYNAVTAANIRSNRIYQTSAVSGIVYGIVGVGNTKGTNINGNYINGLESDDDIVYGIYLESSYDGNTVTKNSIIDIISQADFTIGIIVVGNGVNVTNNVIQDITSTYNQPIRGIIMTGNEHVISGNLITDITISGTGAIYGIASTATNGTITGNSIKDMSTTNTGDIAGIHLSSAATHATVIGNNIKNFDRDIADGAGNIYGIYLGSTHSTVSGQNIDDLTITNGTGTTYGIYEDVTGGDIGYCSISSNTISSIDDYGIYIVEDDNSITGNNITSCDTGIETAATADATVVAGNKGTGNTTDNFDDNGTLTVSFGNDWT